MKLISSRHTKAVGALLQRFKERQDAQNPMHGALQIALDGLMEQVSSLEVIRQTRSATTSPEHHAGAVAHAADRVRRFAEGISKKLAVETGAAEGSFAEALREHSGLKPGPFGLEIRQRLHGLTPGERVKAVQTLIEGKDGTSLQAILDAPPMLSGLPAEELSKAREQYYVAVAPDIVKARDVYRELTEHVNAAIQTAQSAVQVYGDPVKLRELEEREAVSLKAQGVLNG